LAAYGIETVVSFSRHGAWPSSHELQFIAICVVMSWLFSHFELQEKRFKEIEARLEELENRD
jgi:hypothetical protein